MPETLLNRIQLIMSHYALSPRAFDLSIGKSNGYIGKQIKRGASIGSDTIETILHVYADISPSWLIAGEGEMFRRKDENTLKEPGENYVKDYFEETLIKYLHNERVKDEIKNIVNLKRDGEEE